MPAGTTYTWRRPISCLRSLVIEGWDLDKLAACGAVIVALGVVLTALSLRAIATYDR